MPNHKNVAAVVNSICLDFVDAKTRAEFQAVVDRVTDYQRGLNDRESRIVTDAAYEADQRIPARSIRNDEPAEEIERPSCLDQTREALVLLSDSNRFPASGNALKRAQTIRRMRKLARKTLREMPS